MRTFILLILIGLFFHLFSTDEKHPFVTLIMQKAQLYNGFSYQVKIETKGIENKDLEVKCINCTISKEESKFYSLRPDMRNEGRGSCEIEIYNKKELLKSFKFLVGRFAAPRPELAFLRKGTYTASEFKELVGLMLPIINYDIDARCNTVSYNISRVTRKHHQEQCYNEGARFSKDALPLIRKATSGDIYIFDNIVYKCPRDKEAVQHWASKVVRIK